MSKRIVRNGVFGLALATVALAAPVSAQTPSAEAVLDRYVEAVGGADALAAHDYRRTQSEMSMQGMTMTVERLQARPNRLVNIVNVPSMGMEQRTGYTGEVAWGLNPMQGPQLLEGEAAEAIAMEARFNSTLDLAPSLQAMSVTGESSLGDRPCWQLEATHNGGQQATYCFDKESGLLLGVTRQQETPQGTVEAQVTFEDYQEYDGVRMPTVTRMNVMGQQMTLTLTSVSHEPIDESEFALPAEVAALQ